MGTSVKDLLSLAKKSNVSNFSAKVWKSEALQEIANEFGLIYGNDDTDKKVRRYVRKLRDTFISDVLRGAKDSEKNFINFMQVFCNTFAFTPSAILSAKTLQGGTSKSKAQIQNAEKALQKCKVWYENQLIKEPKPKNKK